MRIGFVVNDIATEQAGFTTTRLVMSAVNLGHEAWVMGAGDLAYDPDDKIHARARSVRKRKYKSLDVFLDELRSRTAVRERVSVSDLDVLMLRADPSAESAQRSWAAQAPLVFGRVAASHGVIVVNDPTGLSRAANKMYLQTLPEEVRPRTLITRDKDEIKQFASEQGGPIVLKPLQGSGGESVFLVRPEDGPNLNQIISSVARHGYVVAQEYLEAAEQGDLRLFMMNGRPIKEKGRYAAFRRVRTGSDMRSNVSAGGKIRSAEVDDDALRIADIVRPRLVQDGMFLVGLDIVGDKLMELNVFSPGGLGSAQRFTGVNFTRAVVQALERKVHYQRYYRRKFDNLDINTL